MQLVLQVAFGLLFLAWLESLTYNLIIVCAIKKENIVRLTATNLRNFVALNLTILLHNYELHLVFHFAFGKMS